MWEDDRNRMGGRWLVNLSKTQRNADLDRVWLETVSYELSQISLDYMCGWPKLRNIEDVGCVIKKNLTRQVNYIFSLATIIMISKFLPQCLTPPGNGV